jgi:hypothetical protein
MTTAPRILVVDRAPVFAAGDEKSLILKNAVCHNILLIIGCAKGTVILYNLIHFSTKIAA